MALCCECAKPAIVHIYAGSDVAPDSTYTGASYCSWEHLEADIGRLYGQFGVPDAAERR